MSSKRRINQGGSVITFVVIGVILAAGLIGAVYFLRQRGEQVRKEQAIAIYDKEQADKKAAESEAAKKETASKSETEKSNGVTTTTTQGSAVNNDSAEVLPVTGPGFKISELVGVFLLTVSVVGYLTSRRNLVDYACVFRL